MDCVYIVVLFIWKMARLRKKSTLTLSLSAQSTSSCISAEVNSKQNLYNPYWLTTRNSDSLWLMVMELFMPHYKVTAERSCKRLLSSYPKSTEREVSHQSDLPD